jgi:hypothetical protein
MISATFNRVIRSSSATNLDFIIVPYIRDFPNSEKRMQCHFREAMALHFI